ncbi:MAG: AmmeMemoRadiSam system protein B [Fibrobacteria bacterium]|nr:AmmeMemoRadiSam system protein B [Fibrobacteria bacterium]
MFFWKNNDKQQGEHMGTMGQDKKQAEQPDAPRAVLYSSLAGSWYSDKEEVLREQLSQFAKAIDGNGNLISPMALILPHAGYRYSAQTAMYALSSVTKTYKRVVVIGPSHRVPLQDQFSVPDVSHYETPLGQVPLDLEFINQLKKHDLFMTNHQVHKVEHSVQIQLPLLQYQLKNFRLVPIVAGQCGMPAIKEAAKIIRGLVDETTLVIASTDFTHYGGNFGYVPFTDDIPANIKKLDNGAYEFIKAKDPEGFLGYCKKTGATICGRVPVAFLLAMLPESSKAVMTYQTTSGAITGDYDNSVSYISASFPGSWTKETDKKEGENGTGGLSDQDKSLLLELARASIQFYLDKGKQPVLKDLGKEEGRISEAVKVPRAAFVTLKENGRLRGCIGDILPRVPLYQSVMRNAVNAAVNDYRFKQVKPEDLNGLRLSVSALTVPKQVSSYRDIRIGTDGVILRKRGRSAVFLPQVAPEQGWNVEETLTHLATKAGLHHEDWKEGAQFEVFQAEVFREEK